MALKARASSYLRRERIMRGLAGVVSLVGLAILPHIALAQKASRVAPESLIPLKPNANGAIDLPASSSAQVPPGAEQLHVVVADVQVEGGAPAFADVITAKTARFNGHTVVVSDLYQAAAQIEAAYARAGFVLTRVTLPPQRLVDGGSVKFLITDGFIERVDVRGVPVRLRRAVERRVISLVGQHGLTLEQIERRVLLAGDVPGVQLRSTLVRGDALGATQLVLEGQYAPLSGSLSVENGLGAAYQYESFSANLALNSALGLGEQIYFQAATSPDFEHLFGTNSHRRIYGGGVLLPIGRDGFTLNPEYTRVDTNPVVTTPGAAQITGQYERLVLRATYPLIKTRRQSLDLTGSFELLSEIESAKAVGLTLNQDRLRVATLGINWARSIRQDSNISTELLFTQGIAGLGARTQADALASGIPLTRQGSGPDFSKLSGRARYDMRLGQGFNLSNVVRGQATLSGALPSSSQFSLDGSDSLSAFSQGSLSVDSGIVERVELARSFGFGRKSKGLITPYIYGAVGAGHLSNPTVLELPNINTWSAGGGLRLLLAPAKTGLTSFATIELSHGHANILPEDPTRVNASISFRF